MTPELALAITATIDEGSSLLIKIGKKVNEARKFRRKCALVKADAELLLKLLANNKEGIDGLETLGALKKCLAEIEAFVTTCATWSKVDVGLEVFIRHEFPALREKTRELREKFTFDVEIETLARQRAGFIEMKKTHTTIVENQKIALESLAIVRNYVDEERKRRSGKIETRNKGATGIKCDFQQGAMGFKVNLQEEVDVVGRRTMVARGTIEGLGKVICTKIEQSPYTLGYLEVYKNIQYTTGVQMFFGTMEVENEIYAVMEDLDDEITLQDICGETSTLLTQLDKIGLAYDLCKTVAVFHKAEICLKSLSDTSVVIKKVKGDKWYPVLTGLERSRLFFTKTSFEDYDCRYEAPEYQFTGEHFSSTDIWSLGTIIWQLVSGKFPFNQSSPIDPRKETAKEIRSLLKKGKFPGKVSAEKDFGALSQLIERCWLRGDIRPTAMDITRNMQAMYIQQSFASSTEIALENRSSEDLRLRDDLMRNIQKARTLNPPGTGRPLKITTELKIDSEDFTKFYQEDDDWSYIKSYLVGAALFWGLADLPSWGIYAAGEAPIAAELLIYKENRNRFALKHLLAAAEGGYTEAYHEIWRAEAALATYHKAKHEGLYLMTKGLESKAVESRSVESNAD